MLVCMEQGGTGHAGERLGEADHPGPGHEDIDDLLAECSSALLLGNTLTAQAIQEKLWKRAQGWSMASVMANDGENNRVSFLRSAFFQDSDAANKHMRDVEWWPAWKDSMMAKIMESDEWKASEVHVPLFM
jgi:hypothetical protein